MTHTMHWGSRIVFGATQNNLTSCTNSTRRCRKDCGDREGLAWWLARSQHRNRWPIVTNGSCQFENEAPFNTIFWVCNFGHLCDVYTLTKATQSDRNFRRWKHQQWHNVAEGHIHPIPSQKQKHTSTHLLLNANLEGSDSCQTYCHVATLLGGCNFLELSLQAYVCGRCIIFGTCGALPRLTTVAISCWTGTSQVVLCPPHPFHTTWGKGRNFEGDAPGLNGQGPTWSLRKGEELHPTPHAFPPPAR